MAEAAPARALDDLNPAFKASEDHLEKQAIAPVSNRPAHYVEIDPKAEAKLRLKLDLCLIPIVTLVNLLSFIDRANIGNARVAGLDRDVGMKGYEFQYVQMGFYIMYLVVEVPSQYVFKRLGSIWLGFLCFGFGVTSIGSAFVHSTGALAATRILLGTFEGGLMPGITYLLSRYYRRQELVFRIGIFLALSPSLSGAFGGLLATGFLSTDSVGMARDWRKIFLWEGLITAIVGLAAMWLIPTWPEKTRMLNEEERYIAIHRVQNENESTNAEDAEEHWLVSLKGAFNLPTVACIIFFGMANSTVQGMAVFMPTIIRTLGRYTPIQIQLRTVPPNVVAAVWSVILTYFGWKVQRRGLLVFISLPMSIIGWAFFIASRDPQIRYAGCFLTFTGTAPLGPVWLAWAMNNVGSPTSRGVASGLVVGLGTVGSIIGMWCFTNDRAPNFILGSSINCGFSTFALIGTGALWWWVRHENLKRDRGDYDHRIEGKTPKETSAMGSRNPRFRFVE